MKLLLLSFGLMIGIVAYSQGFNRYESYTPVPLNYPQLTQEQLQRQALVNYLNELERKENFSNAIKAAFENYNSQRYDICLIYVNSALKYGYNSDLSYIQGMAYLQLGDLRKGKAALKKAKRKGNYRAAEALNTYF